VKFQALAALFCVGSVYGGLITTAPVGGTTTPFDTGGTCGGAGTATDAGFSITANGASCFPYSDSFGFNDNGTWNGLGLVGDNSGSTLLTINLGGLYSSVGGFMDYAVIDGDLVGPSDPTITALAEDGTTVLYSYDLFTDAPIDTGGADNAGAFRGITSTSANIAYLQFGGSFLAMDDITLGGAIGTPEPAAFLLTGIGIAALGIRRRAKRSS